MPGVPLVGFLTQLGVLGREPHLLGDVKFPGELQQFVSPAAGDPVGLLVVGPGGHDDLPVDGRPYRSLDKTSRLVLATRAEERVKALNWLMGKASAP